MPLPPAITRRGPRLRTSARCVPSRRSVDTPAVWTSTRAPGPQKTPGPQKAQKAQTKMPEQPRFEFDSAPVAPQGETADARARRLAVDPLRNVALEASAG